MKKLTEYEMSKIVSKNKVKEINVYFSVIFYLSVIYFIGSIALIIYSFFISGSEFQVFSQMVGDKQINHASFREISIYSFDGCLTNEAFLKNGKTAYLIGRTVYIIEGLVWLYIIKIVMNIFNCCDVNVTPFTLNNAKKLSLIGKIMIISSVILYNVKPILLMLFGLGGFNWTYGIIFADWDITLIGVVVLAFSYIFRYGVALQEDNDMVV